MDVAGLKTKLHKIYGGPVPELKPLLLLMCADHGIAKYGISAFKQEVTLKMMQSYGAGTAAANVLARHCGADVWVADVGTAFDTSKMEQVFDYKYQRGTNDFTVGPAMSGADYFHALTAGSWLVKDAVQQGYNCFILGEMAIGNTTSSAALISAVLGLSSEVTVGHGSGIDDARMLLKRQLVQKGIEINQVKTGDGVDALQKLGGFEHVAMAGAMLEAAEQKRPVILDGINATAAALCAQSINQDLHKSLIPSHLSAEPGHRQALEALQLEPIVDVGMRIGEGTGAEVVLPLLRILQR